tara:strand:- start:50 stop:271 length:222 start_codon:yes stop_codon:yes gene_type:complete
MKERIKSWKTTIIGIIAILGLAYKAYTSGGFEVSDFLLLFGGVGFIGYKKSNHKEIKKASTVDPIRDFPDERG